MPANNTRDVIIRIVGQNILGPSIRSAESDINRLTRFAQTAFKQAFGVFGKVGVGFAAGGAAGAGFALLGTLGNQIDKIGSSALKAGQTGLETFRRQLLSIDPAVIKATKSLGDLEKAHDKLMIKLRAETAKRGTAVERAFRDVIDVPRLEPGLKVEEQRAVNAQREALRAERDAAIKRAQLLKFPQTFGGKEFKSGQAAFVHRRLNEMKLAGQSTLFAIPDIIVEWKREVAQADKDVADIDKKFAALADKVEQVQRNRDTRFGKWMKEMMSIGAKGVGQGIFRGATAVGDVVRGPIRDARDFLKDWKEAIQIEKGGESPAEQIIRQIRTLERLQRGPLGALAPQFFQKARRNIFLEGIGQLPAAERAPPGLQAVEGRNISRGRAQDPGDELSALRRERKEADRRQEKQLAAVLRALQGGGDIPNLP